MNIEHPTLNIEHRTSNIEVEEGEEAASSRSVGILPTSSIPR
jgi:hypothetical protein